MEIFILYLFDDKNEGDFAIGKVLRAVQHQAHHLRLLVGSQFSNLAVEVLGEILFVVGCAVEAAGDVYDGEMGYFIYFAAAQNIK
jgi:hypothetical protein